MITAARIFALVFALIVMPAYARAEADITIKFGSYCCGTDTVLEGQVMDYIRFSDDIRNWKKTALGFKEGEHSLEINLKADADHAMVYDDLRKMIPRYSDKAPTSIEGKGFAKFETGMNPPGKKEATP